MLKSLTANTGDKGLIPGLGRSPGGGNCNPPQYSCLGNPMDRGAESNMTEQLSMHALAKGCSFKGEMNYKEQRTGTSPLKLSFFT